MLRKKNQPIFKNKLRIEKSLESKEKLEEKHEYDCILRSNAFLGRFIAKRSNLIGLFVCFFDNIKALI